MTRCPTVPELSGARAGPSTLMSTKAERGFRAARRILPIKVEVPQPDGSKKIQVVDADVRTPREDFRARRDTKARTREDYDYCPFEAKWAVFDD